jgi:hypothetical protein
MTIAQKIESMRVAHEARAFREWEDAGREDDELDAEVELILRDPVRLGEACHDADPCMSIIDAATIEARKRLGVCA